MTASTRSLARVLDPSTACGTASADGVGDETIAVGCRLLADALGWPRAVLLGYGPGGREGVLATCGEVPGDAAAWAAADGRAARVLHCFGLPVGRLVGERGPAPSARRGGSAAPSTPAAGGGPSAADGLGGVLGLLLAARAGVEGARNGGVLEALGPPAQGTRAGTVALEPIRVVPRRLQLDRLDRSDGLVRPGSRPGGACPGGAAGPPPAGARGAPGAHPSEERGPEAATWTGPACESLLALFPGVVVVTAGPEHRIVAVNPLAAAVSPGSLALGAPLARVLPPAWAPCRAALEEGMRTGRRAECLVPGPTGGEGGVAWGMAILPYGREAGPAAGLVLVAAPVARGTPALPAPAGGAGPAEPAARTVLDACGTALMLIAFPEMRVVYHNAAMTPLLGGAAARRGSAAGMRIHDLIGEETWAQAGPALLQMVATGQPVHLPALRATWGPDEPERLYDWTLAPIFNAAGALTHAVASALEVTAQVHASAEVDRRARAAGDEALALREALNGLEQAIGLFDARGRLTWCNDAYAAAGYPPRPGQDYAAVRVYSCEGEAVPPEARPLRLALDGRPADDGPYWVGPPGGERLVTVRARPLRDPAGTVSGALLLVAPAAPEGGEAARLADLVGSAVRRSDALGAVISSLSDGVLITDTAGDALLVNRAFCDLHGMDTVPRTLGERIAALGFRRLDGAPLRLAEAPSARALRGEPVVGLRLRGRHAAGRDVVLEVNAAPIREADGAVAGCVCALRDVTRQQVLTEERDDFLSVAAHELRTPLTVLQLVTQLLAREQGHGALPESAGRHLPRLAAATQRLRTLVDELLDVSRLERGTFRLACARTDLARLVDRVARRFAAAHPDRALRVRLEAAGAEVEIDAQRIEQVLDGLLDNALKYGTGQSAIDLTLRRDAGGAVCAVGDGGNGLPAADLERVFTRYYRSTRHPATHYTGLGLGLFVARQIADLHGGELTARNRPEGGLEVSLRLPLADP